MDVTPSSSASDSEAIANSNDRPPIDPNWEKWRNEQVQTISSILSNVFRVEDEVRQCQAPSRLLRNPARQSIGNEQEVCEKLNAIRQQISEYEQMLQLSLKRIDKALKVVQPTETTPAPITEEPKPTRFVSFKNWVKGCLKNLKS